jgi:hypothetical protein
VTKPPILPDMGEPMTCRRIDNLRLTASLAFDSSNPRKHVNDEIEERSAEVRSGWSKAVSQRRQAWFDPAWRPPLILTIDLVRQMNEKQE